jgi:FeoA domain
MSKLRRKYGAVRLSEAPVGQHYEILRVYEKDPKFLEFLSGLGLRPSTKLRILQREYDETMKVSVGNHSRRKIYLGKPAGERIWVRRLAS